jgi:hypothetical protein
MTRVSLLIAKLADLTVGSDSGTAQAPHSKPKHPNQYTYRPKSVTQVQQAAVVPPPAVPTRRVPHATTPVPSLPPPAQHEHGTRRAGAIANGTIPPPPNTISVHNLHWYLPEHLVQYADILPTPDPIALEARSSRNLSYLPRNHFTNQKYGPFSEDRDDKGKLILPEDPGSREVTGNMHTRLEPPARVRYPAKRITTAEIRKRVRNMLEYVSKVQSEEAKRKQRAEMIGIDIRSLGKAIRVNKDGEEDPEDDLTEPVLPLPDVDGMEISHESEETPVSRPPRQSALGYANGITSDMLMDDLMRDLIAFQESFATGGGHGLGGLGVSPLLPSVSTFGSAPPTPAMPSVASVPTASIVPALEAVEGAGPIDSVDHGLGDVRDVPSPTVEQSEQLPQTEPVNPEGFTDVSQQEIVTSPTQILVEPTEIMPDISATAEAPSDSEQEMQAVPPSETMIPTIASPNQVTVADDVEMAIDRLVEEPTAELGEKEDDGMDLDDLPIPNEMTGTDEPTTGLLSMPSMPASNGSTEQVEIDNADVSSIQPVTLPTQVAQEEPVPSESLPIESSPTGEIKSVMGELETLSELETPVDVYREGKVDEVLTNEDERVVAAQRSGGIGVGMSG